MKKTCLVETQSNTIDELQGKIKKLELEQELEQEQEELNLQIKLLIERAFARRSERYLNDPNQLQIEGLPEHLPRYEVEAEVSDDDKHCEEHGERKVIGSDRAETLEFERPKLRVRVTKYPKFACENQPEFGVASHARRKIYESREVYPKESSLVRAKFQQLYDIEDRGKSTPADDRLALRQNEAKRSRSGRHSASGSTAKWRRTSCQKDVPARRWGTCVINGTRCNDTCPTAACQSTTTTLNN